MNLEKASIHSQYLGDGVYLIDKAYDGYHYWLITTDGVSIQNKIALDHYTVMSLLHALRTKLGELRSSTISIHTQAD